MAPNADNLDMPDSHKVLSISKKVCYYGERNSICRAQFQAFTRGLGIYPPCIRRNYYYIDYFCYVEPPLHSSYTSQLIMAYNPFDMLLALVCWNFVEDFYIFISDIGV